MSMKQCHECGWLVSTDAKRCPACGAQVITVWRFFIKLLGLIPLLLFVFIMFRCTFF